MAALLGEKKWKVWERSQEAIVGFIEAPDLVPIQANAYHLATTIFLPLQQALASYAGIYRMSPRAVFPQPQLWDQCVEWESSPWWSVRSATGAGEVGDWMRSGDDVLIEK